MSASTSDCPAIGLIIIGDEILSGKRSDQHLPKVIETLAQRGLSLSWAQYVGDDPERLTALLATALAGRDLVFSCGGIGATPDDHTRQCAAKALGLPLQLHPEAQRLIQERMREMAEKQGVPYEPDHPDQVHRLNMGVFPQGAQIVPNPYNKIPGFHVRGPQGAQAYFMPGFPVMAWPMIEWALDTHHAQWFQTQPRKECSVIVFGAMEASLTPLMLDIEQRHPGVKIFSLPSVNHPKWGRHVELGVKGTPSAADRAYADLKSQLERMDLNLGPELVR